MGRNGVAGYVEERGTQTYLPTRDLAVDTGTFYRAPAAGVQIFPVSVDP